MASDPSQLPESLGRSIQLARKALGHSQLHLAQKIGVSRATLDHIEKFDGKLDVGFLKVLAAAREVGLHVAVHHEDPRLTERRLEREKALTRAAKARETHLRLAALLATGDRAALDHLRKARRMVGLWRENKTCSARYIEGWDAIVRAAPRDAARGIAGIDPAWADAMFQNSPFHSAAAR